MGRLVKFESESDSEDDLLPSGRTTKKQKTENDLVAGSSMNTPENSLCEHYLDDDALQSLLSLSPQVWSLIFKNLDVQSLTACRLVCKTWNRLAVPVLKRISCARFVCLGISDHKDVANGQGMTQVQHFLQMFSDRTNIDPSGMVDFPHPFRDIYLSFDVFYNENLGQPVKMDAIRQLLDLRFVKVLRLYYHTFPARLYNEEEDWGMLWQLFEHVEDLQIDEFDFNSEKHLRIFTSFLSRLPSLKRLQCYLKSRLLKHTFLENENWEQKFIWAFAGLTHLEELLLKVNFFHGKSGKGKLRVIQDDLRILLPKAEIYCFESSADFKNQLLERKTIL